MKKMTLETTSGDVYIYDLNVDELVMHSRSGDLTMKNVTTTDLTTKLTSGTQTKYA